MVKFCEDKLNLSFSVDEKNPKKSKCRLITFSRNGKEENKDIVKLKGVTQPSTTTAKHLGHFLTSNCLSDHDTVIKKCQFISKSHNLLQEFYYSHPDTKIKLIRIYCCSLYSSPLWDLYGKECRKLFNQWNVLIRTAWDIDRETHGRFIEKISETDHLKKVLSTRTINFYKQVISHDKESVRFMANLSIFDTRTTCGKKLRKLNLESNMNLLNCRKSELKIVIPEYLSLPDNENWKPSIIREIVTILKGYSCFSSEDILQPSFLTRNELTNILDNICCY